MSNTLVRTLVAVVAVPIIIWLIYQGGWLFTGFVELLVVLGLKEYYDMANAKGIRPNAAVGYVAVLPIPVLMHIVTNGGGNTFLFPMLFLGAVILVMAAEMWRKESAPIVNTATTVFGLAYVGLGMSSLVGVRNIFHANVQWSEPALATAEAGQTIAQLVDYEGFLLVVMMFVAVWVCDSVAYFVGRAFGKHKIAPAISPKKSWEGGIAGLVGAACAFAGLGAWLLPHISVVHTIILGALAGTVGQIGDFAESWLKRDAGVKDSSSIIPGHGGILDRFDSILFVAPVVFIYMGMLLLL
jgi:phosphatidate cytidylyltransferase